jgi:anti-sigma B factor antagonist
VDLTIETQLNGSWTVLQVAGELDLHTSPALRDRISELLDAGTGRLAIDLEHVGFMDSSSVGILVAALKRIGEKDGDLALVGVSGSPLKVLSLTGIDRLMPMYATSADLPE